MKNNIQQVVETAVTDPTDYCNFSPVSWEPKNGITFDQWEEIGFTIQQMRRSLNWWIGDWLEYGSQLWGEKHTQAIEDLGISKDSLIDYAYVARQIPANIRKQELSWSCHRAVVALSPDEQEHWLNVAVKEGLDTRLLRERIRRSRVIDTGNGEPLGSDEDNDPGSWNEPEDFGDASPYDIENASLEIRLKVALADLIAVFEEQVDGDHPVVKAAKMLLQETAVKIVEMEV